MAKQHGIVPIRGTIGNLTFSRTQDGFMAGQKGGISKERIASDPSFELTRKNNADFGTAGASGALLRKALRNLIRNTSDSRMVSRLTRKMSEILKSDTVNRRGLRRMNDGDITKLEKFEFNNSTSLFASFPVEFSSTIDRPTGTIAVSIPAFIPADEIVAPLGATHFRFQLAGVAVDFDKGAYTADIKATGYLPLDQVATAVIDLVASVPSASTLPLFLALGIKFFSSSNGMDPMRNEAHNALSIVKVDQ